jgi:trk system potassium uptake protein TrkA
MKIIIVGCGKIGKSMISSLTSEGHDLTIVDKNSVVLNETADTFDVIGVCGNAVDCDTLMEADVKNADLLVSVTDSDEVNMLTCHLARNLGVKHSVARIRNPDYNDNDLSFLRQHLNISISINPELLVAEEINNILQLPSAVRVERFSRRNIEMVQIIIPKGSSLSGLNLIKMREKYRANYLICTVQRNNQVFIPDGRFELQDGDKIGIVAEHGETKKLLNMLGLLRKQAKSVMILGGSKPAYYLAKKLISLGVDVKIIEKKLQTCEFLASEIPEAVIIHGDGAQQELLLEEGISNMDAFVSLTGMDEQNIMLSIFASMQNVPKVVAKINRDELLTMAENLGVETIISPSHLSTNVIARYARALKNTKGSNVETLYKLLDGRAEALEFIVANDSKTIGIPFKNIKLKSNILVAGITRDTQIIIPSGNDMILAGDRVIVIAAEQRLNDLDDILL